jgi:hypothetical protein
VQAHTVSLCLKPIHQIDQLNNTGKKETKILCFNQANKTDFFSFFNYKTNKKENELRKSHLHRLMLF